MDDQTTDLDHSSLRGASAFSDVIVSAFVKALSAFGSNEAHLEKGADSMAREIFTKAPLGTENQRDEKAVALQQQACGVLLEIAKFVPHHHRGQLLLVRAVAKLEERCQQASYAVLLGQELRDRWIGPISNDHPHQAPTLTSESPDPTISDEDDSDEEGYYPPDEWLSLNSFATRVLGARIAGFTALQSGSCGLRSNRMAGRLALRSILRYGLRANGSFMAAGSYGDAAHRGLRPTSV